MEMLHRQTIHLQSEEFKIDLIVWKYNKTTMHLGSESKFKIDLIVWK